MLFLVNFSELLSRYETIIKRPNILRVINIFESNQHIESLGDVIRFTLYSKVNANTHTKMRQNKCVYDITSRAKIGGVIRDMVLVERALNWARTDIVGETRRILLGEPRPVLDLTGLIKGVIALEDMGLYSIEENVGRSTTKIDMGIELYNMEDWD